MILRTDKNGCMDCADRRKKAQLDPEEQNYLKMLRDFANKNKTSAAITDADVLFLLDTIDYLRSLDDCY